MDNEKDEKKRALLDPGNMLFVLYVGFVLGLILLAMVVDGQAAVDRGDRGGYSLSEVRQGELLFPGTKAGEYLPAPRLSQDVEIYVSAMVARTVLRQRFLNGSRTWQEAIYVFPLPDESGVDQLRIRVGERLIEGEIREKIEARKIYEQARKEGKKASLLAQERPNIFTVSVANIGPGEEVEVEIEYQQVVELRDGTFSLRFPMVVGPRYIPGTPLAEEGDERELHFAGSGWSLATDQVPDAPRITPPVATARENPLNPLRLMVELAAGFPVARVESLYHGIRVADEGEGIQVIRFSGEVVADRDFVLEWEAEKLDSPHAALFSENRGQSDYLLLMLMPPQGENRGPAVARELIFVLDTSGSMAGPSIIQAREALVLALSRLHDSDRFNVIEFNSTARKLFSRAEAADNEHRKRAIRFVQSLQADGGTEIASALELALDGRQDHERIRQVIFLTDGSVGNEENLLAMIDSRLGDSRLFTVGIGSAPNSYFMSRAAAMGRGSFTSIGKVEEVQEKMMALFEKLEHPAVTALRVEDSKGQALEYYPHPLPDLYQGEPLLISLKRSGQSDGLRITGRLGDHPWQQQVAPRTVARRPGIARLWARKKIRTLMDSLALGGGEKEIRGEVLATALEHHLVSRYTSLVAVEKQVSRPPVQGLEQTTLPTNLPQGWQANKIFGGTSQTATPAARHLLLGGFLLLIALLLVDRKRRAGL
ncbi:MAG: marine proteobacterial sortase target protein [Proteobacteria bacterium]|nr:marine proteobacterial sortase target protein [Pseudomonadota bacterium]MBU1057690.1 marine proteobacterial sortase target protein [Pseudomonadota bacterium]